MDTSTKEHTKKLLGGIFQQLIKNGGGMVVSLTLTIFVTPAELGAFAIVIAVHGFFNLMHAAFLSEPLTLFARREFSKRQAAYFATVERIQIVVGFAICTTLALAGAIANLAGAGGFIVSVLWILAVVQPLALWSNYLERRLYVDLRAGLALWGAATQLITVIGAIILASQLALLNVSTALGILGAGYGISALIHGALLRQQRTHEANMRPMALAELASQHLAFGRWAALAHGLWWLVQNLYIFANGIILSLAAVGSFKILITLSNFGTLAMSAMGVILMSMLVAAKDSQEKAQVIRLGVGLVFLAGSLFAVAFLGIAPWGIPLLFGEKFSIGWPSLALAGLYPLIAGLQFLTTAVAKAQGRPKASAYGSAIALTGTAPIGLAMVVFLGVPGSMAAQLLTVLGVFVATACLLRR